MPRLVQPVEGGGNGPAGILLVQVVPAQQRGKNVSGIRGDGMPRLVQPVEGGAQERPGSGGDLLKCAAD